MIEDMSLTREYCSIFDALRLQLQIPKSQPLLDLAFGRADGKRNFYLPKEYWSLIQKEENIYPGEIWGQDTVKPDQPNWKFYEKNGLWVGLYTYIPDWLKEIGDKRKQERQQIMENKNKEKLTLDKD
ncbi:MAG: hypothetical protein IPI60_17955 [Saprospiraceae bacterium]|nr:hypothetical protein [Saprospiraceae bacterium]